MYMRWFISVDWVRVGSYSSTFHGCHAFQPLRMLCGHCPIFPTGLMPRWGSSCEVSVWQSEIIEFQCLMLGNWNWCLCVWCLGPFYPRFWWLFVFFWHCFNWSCNIKAQQLHPGSHWHQCGTTRGGAAKSRKHLRRNPCVAHGGQLGHGGRHPDGHSFELQPFWSCDVTWQKRKNEGCFMKTRLT